MFEHVRDFKDGKALDRVCNPMAGMVGWLEILRDLRLKGKVEI